MLLHVRLQFHRQLRAKARRGRVNRLQMEQMIVPVKGGMVDILEAGFRDVNLVQIREQGDKRLQRGGTGQILIVGETQAADTLEWETLDCGRLAANGDRIVLID